MTPITLALSGAAAYPRACQALSSMLSKKALNPADITIVSTKVRSSLFPPKDLGKHYMHSLYMRIYKHIYLSCRLSGQVAMEIIFFTRLLFFFKEKKVKVL